MSKKILIADTNIWLLNPHWIENYKNDHIIVIPQIVIEELDNKKHSPGLLGVNARIAIKMIGEIAKELELGTNVKNVNEINIINHNDSEWIVTAEFNSYSTFLNPLTVNDDRIIATGLLLKNRFVDMYEVIILSNDCNVRTKVSLLCDLFHITSEVYSEVNVNDVNNIYHIEEIEATDDMIAQLYETHLKTSELPLKNNAPFTPIYFKTPDKKTVLAYIYPTGDVVYPIADNKEVYKVKGIKPANDQQKQFISMMRRFDSPHVIACVARTGAGKTLIALATAIQMVEDGRFSHIELIKPVVSLGNTVGYLKGDMEDKIAPIKNSFDSAAEEIGVSLESLEDRGLVSFNVPEYLRGITFHNSIVIVDEAQNLTPHEIKSIITRCGENSKVILLGDLKQVDNTYLSSSYNGLTHVIDKLSGQDFFACMYMNKSERAEFLNILDDLL